MQKINLKAQSVLELSNRENADDDNDNDDNDNDDDDDTHPGWIIVRDGKYSVKKYTKEIEKVRGLKINMKRENFPRGKSFSSRKMGKIFLEYFPRINYSLEP